MAISELEELAWRTSGMFDEKDVQALKQMFSIKRNKDSFDKEFYDNDMDSMTHFIGQSNFYDDRIALLEEWLIRKEDEIKQRVVTPPKHMKRPDHELHEQIDKHLKQARESLVSKFLARDESGNTVQNRDYKDLTTKELSEISGSIASRLNLFNGSYPEFMPQVVKAVMEHPNLAKTDKDSLDTYCKMFELDWRQDRSHANKQQFLSVHPVYLEGTNFKEYGTLDNFEVMSMIRQACTPFVPELAKKMMRN